MGWGWGILVSNSNVWPTMEKSWWQKLEAVGHIVSTVYLQVILELDKLMTNSIEFYFTV